MSPCVRDGAHLAGYCTNRLSETGYPDARSQRLVAALYEAL